MHAYLKMEMDPSSPAIPLQYNYLVQAAIYAALPENIAARLHDEGFRTGKRKFKMFTFSRLLGKYVIDRTAGTITFPEEVRLVISSPDMEFFLPLMNSLLTENNFRIGNSLLSVKEVRLVEQLAGSDELVVRPLSPVVVYSTLLKPEGGKYTCFFQPGESEFTKLVTANLQKKFEAFYGRRAPEGEVLVRPLDRPRLHVTSYKGTVVKGYTGRLKIGGPRELLQIALDAGLGSKGSQGYGCVEIIPHHCNHK